MRCKENLIDKVDTAQVDEPLWADKVRFYKLDYRVLLYWRAPINWFEELVTPSRG